jgi:hypothetical protein
LLILPPSRGQHGRCQIGNPPIPTVQISRATSQGRQGALRHTDPPAIQHAARPSVVDRQPVINHFIQQYLYILLKIIRFNLINVGFSLIMDKWPVAKCQPSSPYTFLICRKKLTFIEN